MWIVIGLILFVFLIVVFTRTRDKKLLANLAKQNKRNLLATVTKQNRGTETERDLVFRLLKCGITARAIFHDLYVRKPDGHFSQIDLVVATKVGIIVIEVKDMSGWIFGSGRNYQWTQVLAYGRRKHRFYNPIMQNNRHIIELKKQLRQFDAVPFYSIVIFYGDCVLKDISFVPKRTYLARPHTVEQVISDIMHNNEPARYTDKHEIIRKLEESVNNGEDSRTQIQHIINIREMVSRYTIQD